MMRYALAAAGMVAVAAPAPQRLAIYYGYPTLVEQAGGDLSRATTVFAQYDTIVFGDGLELPDVETADVGLKAERQQIASIISAIHKTARRPVIYGYVALGSTQNLALAEIERRVERWRTAGADGIFFDEAGNDFGVDATRRRVAVCAAHGRGLAVFMNAFNPDDLFSGTAPPGREPCDGRLGPRDALLVESFAIRNGDFEPLSRIDARASAALEWRERTGVRVFGVTTTDGRPFSREEFNSAWQLAAARGFDGFGWGEQNFSANSRLPWRGQP